MINLPTALAAHLQSEVTTLATCWKVQLQNGTVLGFTDHVENIVYNGVTYQASSGYNASAVETSSAMNVDNLEITGALNSASINDDDVRAGLWDYAAMWIFQVNYEDLTMGILPLRRGWLGQVSDGRSGFQAELRGLMQALQQNVGRVFKPTCDAEIGDSRCGFNIASRAVTGTVASVVNNRNFTDPARTEVQPSSQYNITAITKANPCQITVSQAINFGNGESVALSGINGMTDLNGDSFFVTVIDQHNFTIQVDSTNFAAYANGGIATLQSSAYWANGLITWTSGKNKGLSMEVRTNNAGGQILLEESMPYDIAVGDAYSMTPGCDKLITTCRDKYNNVVNFRGCPHVPGQDRMLSGG